jgi:hypothetical protein
MNRSNANCFVRFLNCFNRLSHFLEQFTRSASIDGKSLTKFRNIGTPPLTNNTAISKSRINFPKFHRRAVVSLGMQA